MRPNFIIIGAHKAGTSSLYMYLQQHPEIFMPGLKEPRFFSYDESNIAHQQMPRRVFPIRTMKEYEALFEKSIGYKAIGEASPEYLNSSIAAGRILDSCPDVKLIVCLRHPVDRIYSLYQMSFRGGRTSLDFSDWFNAQVNGSAYTKQTLFYYENLKRFFDLYENDRIKVCLFDDMKSDIKAVVADLYDFLQVDQSFTPNTSVTYNQGGMPKNKIIHKLLSNKYLRVYLKPLIPGRMKSIGNKMRAKNLEKAPPINDSFRDELYAIYQDDIKKVEALIERDLSAWLAK